jgi:hypothetical protein
MRIAVIILTIIGALASIGLGVKWRSDYVDYKAVISEASDTAADYNIDISSEMKEVEKTNSCAYALIACGIVAFISMLFMGKLKKITGIILILAAIIPAIFSPISLIFTFFLALGGIFALLAKYKVKAVNPELS